MLPTCSRISWHADDQPPVAQPIRLRAKVAHIEEHAPDVCSLILAPERPAPRFRPGQFLHLALDPYDPSQHWPESRVFSIASPPDDRERLRITVSAVGAFTQRMLRLREGDEVWVKLPYGDFVIGAQGNDPLILIAGGTGITPFVSFFASVGVATTAAVRVLYGVRRSDLLIYRATLNAAAQRFPDLRWQAHVEESPGPGEHSGRLTVESALAAARTTGAFDSATFYISGPPAMLRALQSGLGLAGVPPARVRTDAWD
jgi:ferredoxin-NADP reductase